MGFSTRRPAALETVHGFDLHSRVLFGVRSFNLSVYEVTVTLTRVFSTQPGKQIDRHRPLGGSGGDLGLFEGAAGKVIT